MSTQTTSLPPLPKGYTLDQASGALPPLPKGYTLDSSAEKPPQPSLLNRLATDPNNVPLDSYLHATERGLANIGQGVAQAVESTKQLLRHPIDSVTGMVKGAAALPSQAAALVKNPPTLGEIGDVAGTTGGNLAAGIIAGEAASRMPAMSELVGDKAQAVRDAGTKTVRAVVKGTNTALKRVPEVAGGVTGAYLGHATGIPEGGFLGALAGRTIGKGLIPAPQLPASLEHFGLPDRVLGGPATLPGEPAGTLSQLNGAPRVTPKAVEQAISDSLGGKPLQRNVPLRQQLPALQKPTPAASNLPQGFTPVESSALSGYKYDAATREFESITKDGRHYIHGDVSPEEAQAFADAGSKGKAWQQLRSQNPLVGKVVNGKRVATIKSQAAPTGAEEPDTRVLGSDDLTGQLRASLHKVTGGEISPGVPRYVFRARDIGEEGIPLTNEHASATSSPGQAMRYAEPGQRSPVAGQVVRIDLSKLKPEDYVIKQHPDGPLWIQFTRPLAESEVEQWSGAAKNAGK